MKNAAETAENSFLTGFQIQHVRSNRSVCSVNQRGSESEISHQFYSSFTVCYITNCHILIDMQNPNPVVLGTFMKTALL